MTFSDAIKAGFQTINSRLQLVGVQAVLMIVNCIGFFVVVGIPLGIAFVIFGLDLTGLTQAKDILNMFSNPSDLIAKYFGLVLMVLVSTLLYLLLKITLKLYFFGGSAGMVGRSIIEPSAPFTMKLFFTEAKQLFFPFTWYFSLLGVIYAAIAVLFTLFGAALAAVVSAAKSQDSTLALFLGIFFSFVFSLVAVSVILGVLTVTLYGIAALFFKREGSIKALKDARRFLWGNQHIFWISLLLLFAYIMVSFALIVVIYPFFLIPVIGLVVSLPVELVLFYLWLVVLAVVFTYYYEMEIKRPETGTAEPLSDLTPDSANEPAATDEGSTSPEDISSAQDPGHADALPNQDEKLEG